jgi:hypothetical protein
MPKATPATRPINCRFGDSLGCPANAKPGGALPPRKHVFASFAAFLCDLAVKSSCLSPLHRHTAQPPHTIPFRNSSSRYFVPRHTIPPFHSVSIIDRSSV